ncbi:hypothetical protein [Gardnerella sp. KA00255]|uniref:hypothetical protein n=1 Tax=Gardnerella sp. KA00255 TaxID=2749073 RepID=UPI003BA8B2EA
MIRLRTRLRHVVAVFTVISTLLAIAGCSTSTSQISSNANKSGKPIGNVAIFSPSDGLSLNRHTPLSTWNLLIPEIVKSLKSHGFSDSNIETHSYSNLEEQSQAIQDYVVSKISSQKNKNNDSEKSNNKGNSVTDSKKSETTIVVAPWTDKNGSNNYGDYVTQPEYASYLNSKNNDSSKNKSAKKSAKKSNVKKDEKTDNKADSKNADNTSNDNNQDTQNNANKHVDNAAEKRLASALKLAQKYGMHVVLLSRMIENFEPDAIFNFSTAEEIGEMQAATLVEKLALYKASKDHPKSIEVLLPCHVQPKSSNDSNKSDGTSSSANNAEDESYSDEFARHAFIGIWKVLQPYFEAGTLISPSGKLHAQVEEKDWKNVAFYANDAESFKKELTKRLISQENILGNKYSHIDGIIALNDNAASKIVKALSDFGYKGSAADINPSISVQDIIGNIIGKRNLNKEAVPSPNLNNKKDNKSKDKYNINDNSTVKDSKTDNNRTNEENDSLMKWPIVTGYGAYKDSLPNIVEGKQWITTIENMQDSSKDVAHVCQQLNQTGKLTPDAQMTTVTINNKKVAIYSEKVIAVSATNLKAMLIDPGYVSLADAGL